MIVYTTDHGLAFPRMKCNLYDTGIGVSLMMKHPSFVRSGTAIDSLVSHLDVLPTIYDLIGMQQPEHLQGVSLLPLLQNKANTVRSEVFSEVSYHAAYEPMRCIRTERYKLIKKYGPRLSPVLANIDDGSAKSYLVDRGLQSEEYSEEMLFDLALDPVERINLIHQESHHNIAMDLRSKLEKWMEETTDPLLRGDVPLPAGARINTPDSLSPRDASFI
ncbi:sulfatase/phosphatase domain-containing protein [Paenibacillus sp. TAB 01]|uniref:sulfatase/phosphatase domain-containing protein n=1 Tax=Paenibacillus sp. TAB 01 TaxID=3368988 RepID=UPI00375198BD